MWGLGSRGGLHRLDGGHRLVEVHVGLAGFAVLERRLRVLAGAPRAGHRSLLVDGAIARRKAATLSASVRSSSPTRMRPYSAMATASASMATRSASLSGLVWLSSPSPSASPNASCAVGSGWLKSPEGRVEAYVCTSCGYFEEYVVAPQQVPWEDLEGFSWHSVGGDAGPFR